ncbi:MAG: FAD-dependent thymidylate synthase [Patescibacteria group bacterium]|nr:FAD-dependent thymidylate synthase [Patescibacteria group bacterium]
MTNFLPQKPQVKLLSYTDNAFDLSIASARTCYSPRLIEPQEVSDGQRERIGEAIYEAGHHTPFQHPTFVFGLSGVSRQCIWSFLHSHPFYNSEQSSQRYVVLDEAACYVPDLPDDSLKVYKDAVLKSWEAYSRISELLKEDNFRMMSAIGRIKGQSDKQILVDSEKKAIENARYVVPVCATANLYHTVSGLVLKRYVRMVNACDCPTEAREVVDAMVAAAREVAPDFIDRVGEGALEDGLEDSFGGDSHFDMDLGGKSAKLISYDKDAEKIVAESIRYALGTDMSDEEILDEVLNPEKNPYLTDTLNNWTHSPAMRALNNVHYVFKKCLSHTADSQDQRHRMTPASRPMLTKVHTEKPDFYMPSTLSKNPEAKEIFEETMEMLWEAKNRLLEMGVSAEHACYLLPNAVNVRYVQSGTFLNLLHKWRLRLCFNAQLEIYDNARDELEQVAAVHPGLAKYVGPPCFNRRHEEFTGKEGPCPEGPRWCGVTVWQNWPKVGRPF